MISYLWKRNLTLDLCLEIDSSGGGGGCDGHDGNGVEGILNIVILRGKYRFALFENGVLGIVFWIRSKNWQQIGGK